MGSIMMEPDDVGNLNSGQPFQIKNTTICTYVDHINSKGIFTGCHPLDYAVPLLLLQFSLASGVILLTFRLLKPLWQPLIVSQILGGIILSPSVLGQSVRFNRLFFPARGFILLDVVSSFGFMLYFFLIGVQTDLWIVRKINKRTFLIGFCAVVPPVVITTVCSSFFMRRADPSIANSLPAVVQAEAVLAFPMVASLLAELKIINSEFGRVALSSSMVGGACSFCAMTLIAIFRPGDQRKLVSTFITAGVVAAVIVFAVRPAVMWMIRRNPVGRPLLESYVVALLIGVLVTSFFCQLMGLHIYFGPLILGITIPAGPPIGSALVERLDLIISWVLLPMYFIKACLVIDIFAVKLKNYLIIQFLILLSAFGKFFGAFFTAYYCGTPARDAVSLGLVLNARGLLELGFFKIMKKNKVIDDESFVVMCVSMVLIVGAITPIIRYLYDPLKRYAVYKRRTLTNSRPDCELQVLVCINDQEDVPVAINLLEALSPTKRSPLIAYIIHLVELVGRTTPILIPYKLSHTTSFKFTSSEHIVNAFRQYEQKNLELVTIFPFTAISPSTTLHDDVCSMALDKQTCLILVPFHKKFNSNGAINSFRNTVRIINNNVLDQAPCSVAIVVDRGLMKSLRPITSSWSSYRAAIVFIGGADDREALALGARMAAHSNINLTVIRLIESKKVGSDDEEETRVDNEAVSKFRLGMSSNLRVIYIEEVVMDGTGTVSILCSLGNNFELVMVGRRQAAHPLLVEGLILWNERSELGPIGEVLACSEFMGEATILVVQQHTTVVNESIHNHRRNKLMQVQDGDEDSLINRRK